MLQREIFLEGIGIISVQQTHFRKNHRGVLIYDQSKKRFHIRLISKPLQNINYI